MENGPALRNISAFPVSMDWDKELVRAFLPKNGIPPFGKSKILPKTDITKQKFIILGDTLTTLGAITALRLYFDDQIKIIPNGNSR